MITITEILGRAEQGMTRPFICRADHWMEVYAKGAYAGKRSLCCEWVAGRLAQTVLCGLPIAVPVIALAEVPRALIEASSRKDSRELGAGCVFTSLRVADGIEMTWEAASDWPEETMAALLVLDLWLQNEDRSLSELGGNPNLLLTQAPALPKSDPEGALWLNQPRKDMIWAYDFNLAFDEQFDRARFFDSHVFGHLLKKWPDGFRERMLPRLREAFDKLDELFQQLPLEWLHLDGDETLPVQLDRERVKSVLSLPFTQPDAFWKLP